MVRNGCRNCFLADLPTQGDLFPCPGAADQAAPDGPRVEPLPAPGPRPRHRDAAADAEGGDVTAFAAGAGRSRTASASPPHATTGRGPRRDPHAALPRG